MSTRQAAKELFRAPLTYIPRPGAAASSPVEVPIFDGRSADLPGWQECGFELMRHHSSVADWANDEEIARVHYPEIAEMARELSGCDYALVGAHIKRNPDEAKRHAELTPTAIVHSDFAESYGDVLRDLYRRGDRSAALRRSGVSPDVVTGARRLMIVQFWRNIGPAKMDYPLAFCDARSVGHDELMAFPVSNYAGSGFDFEALGVLAPEDSTAHDWYAFLEMNIDEVLVFRTYDSDRVATGEPYWTPHSAFRDPEVQPGRPSRYSIELRATCVFL